MFSVQSTPEQRYLYVIRDRQAAPAAQDLASSGHSHMHAFGARHLPEFLPISI